MNPRIQKTVSLFLHFIVVVFILPWGEVSGQSFTRLNIPEFICFGDSVYITFGEDTTNNVVFVSQEVELGQHDTLFLPDGRDCPPYGCSYISSVTFDQFVPDAYVESVEAIKYLRIKIEHSYAADIYIGIKCPNEQEAVVLRFGGYSNSDCASHIPADVMGWLSGTNASLGADFGISNHNLNGTFPCDPTAPRNEPGTGWNYCWSNNTVSGYSYASGDGVLYRAGHYHNGSLDSSDVYNHTNFYHPDQSFENLVGCPLNGQWSVEVMDGWASDNGYIFGWDIALEGGTRLLRPCVFDSFAVQGTGAFPVEGNRFLFHIPLGERMYDTTVLYHFLAYDTCGNVLDTSAWIVFRTPRHTVVERQCVENDLPVPFLDDYFDSSVYDRQYHFTDQAGCDSIVHFFLTVWRNSLTIFDTAICNTDLPLLWNGVLFDGPDSIFYTITDVHGADSTVLLILRVSYQDTVDVFASVCKGMPYTWIDGITYYYDDSVNPFFSLPKDGLCDSVLHLHLIMSENPYKANVKVYPNPVTYDNHTVVLNDVSSSKDRQWLFGDQADTSRICSFVYPIPDDSVLVLFSAHDRYGCTDSVTIVVYSDLSNFWVPNAFTPDESTNEHFFVKSFDIISGVVNVFSRDGLSVCSFDALTGSWDGTKNGNPCPQGTYVWKLTYTSRRNPDIYKQAVGTVTLLR